jgi:hypothetical protein
MSEPKIRIYVHPNPEIKSFTTMESISPPRVEYFKNPLNKETEESLIRIKPKEIRMKKEEDASWDDIEGKVCKILKRALQRKGIKIVKC